jgi:hypothetical protein
MLVDSFRVACKETSKESNILSVDRLALARGLQIFAR